MERLIERTVEEGRPFIAPGPEGGENRRVLILWSHLPHYLAACVRVLLREYRAQVLLVVGRADAQENHVPLQAFTSFAYVDVSVDNGPSEAELIRRIRDFAPTIVIAGCPKWGTLTRLARAAKAQGALVVRAVDHYWRGAWQDYASAVLCRAGLIYGFCDGAWVPGSLGRQYARKLGFRDGQVFEGVYTCDTELFRAVGCRRFESRPRPSWPRVFLFIGQYIERKNLATLLRAYSLYRATVSRPWELWCAGQGPLQGQLQSRPGVRDCGYQDATGCAELMAQAGALVLPSWIDHWGVVIHEAACAGLPILASRTCGGTAHLVRDGYNGYSFAPQDAERLCRLMQLMSDEEHAAIMGQNSLKMSWQFDPKLWAEMLLVHVPSCLDGRDRTESTGLRAPGVCGTVGRRK